MQQHGAVALAVEVTITSCCAHKERGEWICSLGGLCFLTKAQRARNVITLHCCCHKIKRDPAHPQQTLNHSVLSADPVGEICFFLFFGRAQDCKNWELRFGVCSVHGMEMLAALLNPGILLPRGKDSKQTEAAGTDTHWTLLRRDRMHYYSIGMNSKVNSCKFAVNCKKCNACTACDMVRLFATHPWLQKFYSLANSRRCCSSDAANIEKASRR